MARNKHPEETVRLILDAATRLFIERGYDETSLQDIIDETKLSKGAIYHHFASKEEIFVRICERIGEENAQILGKVRDDKHLNGREKLKATFRAALLHPTQDTVTRMVPYLLDNPRFLAMQIRELYEVVVPEYMLPILEEGVRDGSLGVEHPREVAEAMMTLCDVWMHPLLRPTTPEAVRTRCQVFVQIMAGMGLDVLDDELIDAYVGYARQKADSR